MATAHRGKILLVDDDRFFREVLADAFGEAGFEVIVAVDGVFGVEAFARESPDAVLCDLVMPRMGGVSACLEMARLSGANEPVMVLLTSMIKGAAREHPVAEMGARVHIPKSTPPLDIVIIVEQLLDRKRRAEGAL